MEEITSYRRKAMTPAATATNEPWALQIKQRIGATPYDLMRRYNPDKMAYCADHFNDAAVKTPSVVRLCCVYGTEAVAGVLLASLTRVLIALQDNKTPPYNDNDKIEVCRIIVADQRLRSLPFGALLASLWFIRCRRWTVYSSAATPNKVLEVLQKNSADIARMVASARDEAARAAHTAKQQEHQRNGMSWQDYASSRKIPYASPQEWVAAQLQADSAPRTLGELQADGSIADELAAYLRTGADNVRGFVASALAELAAQGASVASKTDVMRLARRLAASAH